MSTRRCAAPKQWWPRSGRTPLGDRYDRIVRPAIHSLDLPKGTQRTSANDSATSGRALRQTVSLVPTLRLLPETPE